MKSKSILALTLTDITTTGTSAEFNTSILVPSIEDPSVLKPSGEVYPGGKCRFSLITSAFSGTGMTVSIAEEVEPSVLNILHTFSPVTTPGTKTIVLDCCPDTLKLQHTAISVTDWDAKLWVNRG